MKTLIVYYSLGGNTAWTAGRLAEALGADLLPLEPQTAYPHKGAAKFFWGGKSAVMGERPPLRPYVFAPEEYDRIILGFPVWAGTFAPPLRSFVLENRDALQGKRLAAFACESGAGGEKALRKLGKLLDVERFSAELVLVDPKDKPSEENEVRLRSFCEALEEM